MKQQGKIFYGWAIVAMCSVIILITYGIGYNTMTAFNIPMCTSTGITRQQFSFMYTLMSVGQIIVSFYATKILRRLGLLNCIKAGTVLFLGLTLYSCFITRPWQLYLLGLLYAPTFLSGGFFCLSLVIANWFKENRGLATGVVFMSSGLGSVFLLPLVNSWIQCYGWNRAKLYLFFISLVMVPIVFFLLREKPEDMGLKALGAENEEALQKLSSAAASEDLWGYDRKDLLRLPGAWAYGLFVIGLNFAVSMGSTVIPYLCDIGFDASVATKVQSMDMLSLAIGRIAAGFLCDKFTVRKAGKFFIALSPFMPIGLLLAARGSYALVFLVIGYGMAMTLNSVLNTLLIGMLFGRKHFSSVYGLYNAIGGVIGAASPVIYGKIYAQTGSYYPAYQAYTVILIAGVIGFFIAAAITRPKQEASHE
ncbi:MAG: MFS transporter [Firmicutes bacterium]|nr:MFS transporter [Bacillota bacterium]